MSDSTVIEDSPYKARVQEFSERHFAFIVSEKKEVK